MHRVGYNKKINHSVRVDMANAEFRYYAPFIFEEMLRCTFGGGEVWFDIQISS